MIQYQAALPITHSELRSYKITLPYYNGFLDCRVFMHRIVLVWVNGQTFSQGYLLVEPQIFRGRPWPCQPWL